MREGIGQGPGAAIREAVAAPKADANSPRSGCASQAVRDGDVVRLEIGRVKSRSTIHHGEGLGLDDGGAIPRVGKAVEGEDVRACIIFDCPGVGKIGSSRTSTG